MIWGSSTDCISEDLKLKLNFLGFEYLYCFCITLFYADVNRQMHAILLNLLFSGGNNLCIGKADINVIDEVQFCSD